MEDRYAVVHKYETVKNGMYFMDERVFKVFDDENDAYECAESMNDPFAYKIDFDAKCVLICGIYDVTVYDPDMPEDDMGHSAECFSVSAKRLEAYRDSLKKLPCVTFVQEPSYEAPYEYQMVEPDEGGSDIIYRKDALCNRIGTVYASRCLEEDARKAGFDGFEVTESLLPFIYEKVAYEF